ncbi:hypothetical protein QQS21_003998 [Conoideocrella luteorostrata]|uniref:P-loop containing nucleoside triphosphate hydrolase protein n=1 Tax=Conoideocrella luteorostrata TaxID=1105319 RepID=A0AAJ0CUQ0_9HYPO|nr:hypothetical protein QQS21_003998 [Conoideocrella luteorostrata]
MLSPNNILFTSLLEKIHHLPDPPPRIRTQPMQVLCVGLPRSGTESLQQALLHLGYDHTLHGFDMTFEEKPRYPAWTRLIRKKWYGDKSGTASISAAEFDAVLGHCVAVTDIAASMFAVELIDAYPDAKVVLNMRSDLDAWHVSAQQTLLALWDNWAVYVGSFFDAELFWAWHGCMRFLLPILFRAPDGNLGSAVRKNGKLVYRDHCNMIRGLVPKERLLEWYIGDGWEPLCEFLGKPVPGIEFPHANTVGKGWKEREKQISERWVKRALRNMAVCVGGVVAGGAVLYKWCW